MLNFIAGVVLVVWAANFVASLVTEGYDGSAINGVFTVVMGAVIAIKGREAGRRSREEEDDDSEEARSIE